jgi:hypothetical protein
MPKSPNPANANAPPPVVMHTPPDHQGGLPSSMQIPTTPGVLYKKTKKTIVKKSAKQRKTAGEMNAEVSSSPWCIWFSTKADDVKKQTDAMPSFFFFDVEKCIVMPNIGPLKRQEYALCIE